MFTHTSLFIQGQKKALEIYSHYLATLLDTEGDLTVDQAMNLASATLDKIKRDHALFHFQIMDLENL